MKTTTPQLSSLSGLFLLAAVLPSGATSLQLNFTAPASFNESNRQPVLEWTAEPAKTYLVQSTTNLPGPWKIEEPVRATAAGTIRWYEPETIRFKKYYRLVLPQPEVYSVEPAFVNSEDPGALLYVYGQCLPTNGLVRINGQNFTVTAFDPNGSWVALSLNGLPPGTPVIGTLQVLDNGSNVVATLPQQNTVFYGTELTAEQLQGPPDDPPAAAETYIVEKMEFVVEKVERARTAKPGYVNDDGDDDGDGFDSSLKKEFKGHVTLLKRGGDAGSSAARHTKTGHVTLLKRGDGSSSARTGGTVEAALSSGELQSEETDLFIRGRGHDFGWVRNYRSRAEVTTAQGAGWDFSYNVSATRQVDGTVILCPGNGRADTFYPDGTNGWTRDEYFLHIGDVDQDGFPDEVVFPDGGKWILNPPGTAIAGKLAEIVDRNDNSIRCEYDTGTGRLLRVVDTLDRTNTVAYNFKGMIESVTDFSGRTVRYEYDSSGNLIVCVSPEVLGTPNGNDFSGGKTNRYAYSTGNLDERLNHNMVSITDSLGQVTLQITYQATNNPASLEFDSVSSVQRGIEKKDIWRGRVVASPTNSFATVQTIVNDYVGNVTEYLFDSRQRCVSKREFTGRANPALPTTPTQNRPTGKLRAEDPDYFETLWEWNADSLCTREIRPNGTSTEISHQRAQDHNSSRSNKTASRKHDGDVRVLRERASSPVDTDGDGSPDTSELAWHFDYDPRFGSPPVAEGKKLYVGNLPFSASDTAARKGWDGTIKGASGLRKGWDGTIKGSGVKGSSGIDSAKIITDRDTGRSKGFGFVIASTDPRGNLETSEYDSNGNCTRSIRAGHYAVSNFHIQTDGLYNSYGQLIMVTNPPDANAYRRIDTISYYTNGPQLGMVEVMVASALSGGLSLSTAFHYDPRGNVTNIVDPRGNNTLYTYNSLDQCVQSESSSYGGGGGLPPQRITTQYVYDANNNVVRCDVDNRDETAALNGANPQWTTRFEYDALNRLTGIVGEISEGGGLPGSYATNRFVYDGNDNLVESRSPMCVSGADPYNTVALQYDERDLLYREVAAPGSPDQSTTQCDYDSDGNMIRISAGLETGASVMTCTYQGIYVGGGGKAQGMMGQKAKAWMINNFEVHPVFGLQKLLTWVETVWNKQCVEKDTTVRLASITDPMGNVTTFHYDRNSNLKVARHFGETNDVPGSAGNRLFAETRFTYDQFDRCVQQVDSLFDVSTGLPIGSGRTTTAIAFAQNGECGNRINDNGHITRFNYDTAGRLTSITGPRTNVLQLVRDACGNVTSMTASERSDLNQAFQQFSTVYTYDALNRCTASVDNVGNTNRHAYDSRDNLVSHLDPRENESFAVFDGLNRCVATTNYVGKERGITINTSHVEYNTNSRRTADTDSNGNTTQYAYDSLNRCVTTMEADGTSCSLIWSPRSNLLRQQDANGTIITNSYDLLDRCVSRIITPGATVASTTTFEMFSHDAFSRCVAASNNVSLATFAFDSLGRCVRSTQNGLSSSSTYDGVGNCLSQTYPGGRVVTCTYDPADQVASVSSGTGGLPPTLLAQFAYEGIGRVGRVTRANGIGTRVQWNGMLNPPNASGDSGWQQISRVTHAVIAGNILLDQRTLQHDGNQNTISRVRTPVDVISGETNTLSYDALNRLTNVVRVAGSTNDVVRNYVLDGNGNRQVVVENSVSQPYSMDNTSPVPADFQMNQYTSTPLESQEHDENGNVVTRTTAIGPSFYHYDYADRLVQVDGLNGEGTPETIATYAYDALGRRIGKIVNPGPGQTAIQYTHSGDGEIIEERVNGTLTRTYVRPEVDDEVLVAFNQAGQPQYYHYDDAGNTVALTDATGAVTERCDYDDYGKVTFLDSDGVPTGATSSAVGNVYCWSGLCLDSETGLHNDDGGDYFEPQKGKWITSMGLPKVTPKLAKEHHGKFRLAAGNNPWSGGGTKAQDHNSSRSNKTASKAQDHNSSRSNKTSSIAAPGDDDDDDGYGGEQFKEFKGHVTLLKRGDAGGSAMGKKYTKTGHVTLMKRGDSSNSARAAAMSSGKHTKTGHVTLMK